VSDAFRLLLVRVAAEKALPFEPLAPNAETVEAMKAARRGELVNVGKPDKLLGSLNAGLNIPPVSSEITGVKSPGDTAKT
jgi:DNA-damage-inducible protein J